MMDLLLDVNIVVDVCSVRKPWYINSVKAIARCLDNGRRLWLYTGSVQILEYSLAKEIFKQNQGKAVSFASSLSASRELLSGFCQDKNWLAALAGERSVFDAHDLENEQLLQALKRFPQDSIKLLTRDEHILKKYPELSVSPEKYLESDLDFTPTAFVDLSAQQDQIRPTLEKNIHTVLHHGKFIMGPEVEQLEQRLAEFTGTRHCISCSSGTDALLMSLMALDVGPGDAVFTTPFSFIATSEVIALLGATPVFVDIDPQTYNLDVRKLEQAIQAVLANDPALYPLPYDAAKKQVTNNNSLITNNLLTPKAVIPVDLFGLPADYEQINNLAKKHSLWVIEDAAQSLGVEYKGKQAGSLGHIGCTSFFPAKPLGGYGDGGAIFTDDDRIAEELKSVRMHGKGGHKYDNTRLGLNGRLDTMQAAVLLAKMDIFPEEIEKRQEAALAYSSRLADARSLTLPSVPEGCKSAWAQFSILVQSGEERESYQQRLKGQNVPTVIYYPKPIHLQSAFAELGYKTGDMPVSEDRAQHIFSLPMHPYLGQEEMEQVVSLIKETRKTDVV